LYDNCKSNIASDRKGYGHKATGGLGVYLKVKNEEKNGSYCHPLSGAKNSYADTQHTWNTYLLNTFPVGEHSLDGWL
jgi:hypothetical protein